jgi:hypothetical protein
MTGTSSVSERPPERPTHTSSVMAGDILRAVNGGILSLIEDSALII